MAPQRLVLIAHADPLARAYMRNLAERRLRVVDTVEADSFEALLSQLRDEPEIVLVIVDLDLLGLSWETSLRYLEMQYRKVHLAVLCGTVDQEKLAVLAAYGNASLIPKKLQE